MDLRLIDLEVDMLNKYGLNGVPEEEAEENIKYIKSLIDPKLLKTNTISLSNIAHTPICDNFRRIVYCGYGAYIELNHAMLLTSVKYDDSMSKQLKADAKPFLNYTFDDGWHTRVRLQTRPVIYGDFIPAAYYINVGEVWVDSDYQSPSDWLGCQT